MSAGPSVAAALRTPFTMDPVRPGIATIPAIASLSADTSRTAESAGKAGKLQPKVRKRQRPCLAGHLDASGVNIDVWGCNALPRATLCTATAPFTIRAVAFSTTANQPS